MRAFDVTNLGLICKFGVTIIRSFVTNSVFSVTVTSNLVHIKPESVTPERDFFTIENLLQKTINLLRE